MKLALSHKQGKIKGRVSPRSWDYTLDWSARAVAWSFKEVKHLQFLGTHSTKGSRSSLTPKLVRD